MDANETKPTACAPENSLDKTPPSASACEREPAASRGSQVDHRGEPRGAKGKIRARRTAVALFVIALMCFSLAFHSGIGTPSSFGIGTFQLICPLGGIEALLASKTAIPHAIISLVGRLAKPLRPRIEQTTCLEHDGKACASCFAACPAAINLHAEDAEAQLADCTRCGACKDACPTASITFPLLPIDGKKAMEDSNEYEGSHTQ